MKKILICILVFLLLATAAVIGTIAYLTDTETATNVMTVGDVDIALREYERVSVDTPNADGAAQVQTFNDNKPLLPAVLTKGFDYTVKDADVKWDADKDGKPIKPDYTSHIWDPADINNEVDKMVFVENTGSGDAYVRIFFAFEAGNYTSFTRFNEMIHINLNDTDSEWKWEWNPALATSDKGGKYYIATATYLPILKAGEFTTISLSQIALDPTATNADVLAFGEKYEISVFAQGIQEIGFENAEEAVYEGFGGDVPFKNLTFETGVKLKTALHYLNGEESEDKKITANVSTVTFGLNKDYKNITSKYNPTFIGFEQDVAVYSYYVKNDAGKYDIYVLADSKIYTPKDSTGLFRGMTSLTKVDTANMDVSRTEIMSNMFRDCSQLTSLGVSCWDVSNVTKMNSVFENCSNINILDVSEWEVDNVKDMSWMFYACGNIANLNVSNWKVNNVETFQRTFSGCKKIPSTIGVEQWQPTSAKNMLWMFCECENFTELDLSGWDVSTVEQTGAMFEKCITLKKLNVSTWNVSNVYEMGVMFRRCEVLEEIDLSGWKTDSLLRTNYMFENCYKLKNIRFGDGWNMSKTIKTYAMFNNCKALTSLDVSEWNVSNVVDMEYMFSGCTSLTTLDVSKWNTAEVTSMEFMFNDCIGLTELDLGSWNTKKVIDCEQMFAGCSTLKNISVGDNWDMSQVEEVPKNGAQEKLSSGNMFLKCTALVGGKGTTLAKIDAIEGIEAVSVTNKTYAHVDGGESNPGYLTYKAA